jgi:hypothetical protein
MRSIMRLLIFPLILLFFGFSLAALTPGAAEAQDPPAGVKERQPDWLPELTYTATEVGSAGTSFTFDLDGLDGLFQDVEVDEPTWAAGEDPIWFRFLLEITAGDEPLWVQSEEPQWLQGAGLIMTKEPDWFSILGKGTIELPVTGTRTEFGQTVTVTGVLLIVLEEDIIEPKEGVPYFEPCGESCVQFQLRARFYPTATDDPVWLEGTLYASEPQ